VALRIVEDCSFSDVGRHRDTNEDSYFKSSSVFAVADGMGGARAGEVASRIAVEAFALERDEQRRPESQLAQIARSANRKIYALAQGDASRAGMGTTLTAAMLVKSELVVAHVGDSRAYCLRDGLLERLTEDHSLVEELVRQGNLTPEAAKDNPLRSIITRALGPEPEVEIETFTYPARNGDVYLLCSDGLTGMVPDDQVAAILRDSDSLEAAGRKLIAEANASGGRDNITVVLFRLEDD
jgi:serine/threonine protein phosphatase PrpC